MFIMGIFQAMKLFVLYHEKLNIIGLIETKKVLLNTSLKGNTIIDQINELIEFNFLHCRKQGPVSEEQDVEKTQEKQKAKKNHKTQKPKIQILKLN